MPAAYRIDQALDLSVNVWHRDITTQDWLDQLLRLAADPDFPASRTLIDMTTVGEFVFPDVELVDELVGDDLARGTIPDVLVVVVPTRVSTKYVRGEAARRGFRAEIFPDLEAACRYLDVDAPLLGAIVDDLRRVIDSA